MTSTDTEILIRHEEREGEAPAECTAQADATAQQELRPPGDKLRPPGDKLRPPGDSLRFDGVRKRPAHGVYISPVNPTIVYVTVCCDKRVPWLTTDHHHELLLDIWQDTSHWVVGRYVLMPDHLHLIAAPQDNAVEFDAWVKYWKSQFTKRNKNPKCVWQTDHWDTRIRSVSHFEERSIYMFDNPLRAGLVSDSEAWPFKGLVHELRWE